MMNAIKSEKRKQDKNFKSTMKSINQLKNSTLLKELIRRIKLKEIRFNYDGRQIGEDIGGLISWDATDQYWLDFEELERYLENKQQELERNQSK